MKKANNDIIDFQANGGNMEELLTALQNAPKIFENQKEATEFPEVLFDRLPPILRNVCAQFPLYHERDIFLISSLAVLSGIMPNVTAQHRDGWHHLSLYAGIVAPAGNGKGVIRFASRLVTPVENYLVESSSKARSAWKARKDDEVPEPPSRSLFIAANSSARAMTNSLQDNDGNGIICDTEFLTIATATGQDWGNYRDILLKAFHEEAISLDRKDLKVRIDSPHLAVAITGTPKTFAHFFQTLEDGLFSRFLFYITAGSDAWQSQRPSSEFLQREQLFEKTSQVFLKIFQALENRTTNLQITWSDRQWDLHDQAFRHLFESCSESALKASIKRNGVAAFRLACLLSVIREGESDPESLRHVENLQVTDQDVQLALFITTHLYRHSESLASDIATQKLLFSENPKQQAFLSELQTHFAQGFSTKEAIEIGESLDISKRRVEKWLGKKPIDGVERTSHGRYKPAAPAQTEAPSSNLTNAGDADNAERQKAIESAHPAQTAQSIVDVTPQTCEDLDSRPQFVQNISRHATKLWNSLINQSE